MSEVRTRPKVQSVSSAVLSAAAAGAVVAASRVLASAVPSLISLRQELPHQTPASIQPAATLRRQLAIVPAAPNLPPVEAAKVAALLRAAARPYLIQNPAALEPSLAGLKQARTLDQVRHAERLVTAALECEHQVVFISAVTQACQNACRQIGFGTVETTTAAGGVVRVIATDPAGRTLVTEIEGPAEGEPRMATEVVGISDGSCHVILDAFDRALEAQGVRSGPPRRKYTGGVCQLATAREFVRRKVQKGSVAAGRDTVGSAEEAVRRAQRLNTARPARIQQRG